MTSADISLADDVTERVSSPSSRTQTLVPEFRKLSHLELIHSLVLKLALDLVHSLTTNPPQPDPSMRPAEIRPFPEIRVELREDGARVCHIRAEETSEHAVGEIVMRADVGH